MDMDIDQEHGNFVASNPMAEESIRRCKAVRDRIETLTKLSQSCRNTLLRLVELELLAHASFSEFTTESEPSICANIGHFEAVVYILQQPNILAVSVVCKKIPFHPLTQNRTHNTPSKVAHVDIVCTFDGNPVWIIVYDRNPKYLSWDAQSSKDKGLRARVQLLLEVAHNSIALKPTSIIFFFSNGLNRFTREKFRSEYGAVDVGSKFSNLDINFSNDLGGHWVDIFAKSYQDACVLEIQVDCPHHVSKESLVANPIFKSDDACFGGSFGDLMSKIILPNNGKIHGDLINFDTTTLTIIVSSISNGNAQKLLATPEDQLKVRFKRYAELLIGQAVSEIENPIHINIGKVISGRKCIICESVYSQFKELVLMWGGVNEKLRAGQLLQCMVVVPDSPSTRIMSLPTSKKLTLKNKIVFGTGDYWHAPTLTANMGFVATVLATGMSLFTFEHRAGYLTGD